MTKTLDTTATKLKERPPLVRAVGGPSLPWNIMTPWHAKLPKQRMSPRVSRSLTRKSYVVIQGLSGPLDYSIFASQRLVDA